jgi:hypothetical protein
MQTRHCFLAFNLLAALFWLGNLFFPVPTVHWIPVVIQRNPWVPSSVEMAPVVSWQVFPPFLMFLWFAGNLACSPINVALGTDTHDGQESDRTVCLGDGADGCDDWRGDRDDDERSRHFAKIVYRAVDCSGSAHLGARIDPRERAALEKSGSVNSRRHWLR